METLNLEEMTSIWRLRLHLLPQSTNSAIISSASGINIDELIHCRIDDWYFNLIDNGPTAWLPVVDISAKIMAKVNDDHSVTVTLPDNCRRVVSVKMIGWKRNASIITDLDSPEAIIQSSDYVKGGAYQPVALLQGKSMMLYSAVGENPRIENLLCVLEPQPGTYILDRAALATIPTEI
ncbi:MAG: hypothetical protein J6R27_03095 [Muribaculaceae bacterium]|nr:hypothetical protein [Muribaculaceae bacterium]